MASRVTRPEAPSDFDTIEELHMLAFAPSAEEARLVDALREAGDHVPGLCLVALDNDEIAGHIMFSRAQVGEHTILVLAPMAVWPEYRGQDVGGTLIREALKRAARTEDGLVSVIGHARYYPRFGFESASDLGIEAPFEVPSEAWMALRLPAYDPSVKGTVAYAPAFAG